MSLIPNTYRNGMSCSSPDALDHTASDLELRAKPEYQSGMSALRYYRNRAGLTQGRLAELAGTSQPQIRRLESYQRSLTKEWATVLAEPLGVSPDDLLFPSEEALAGVPDIRDIINETRKSIKNICIATGINERLLRNVLDGTYSINDSAVVRLARYLDLEVDYVRMAIGGAADRARSAKRSAKSEAWTGLKLSSETLPLGLTVGGMLVLGEVAAGRWLATEENIDEPKFGTAPLVPDPQWPASAQYGLVVRGTSIDRFAADGDILHCVGVEEAGILPTNGEMVVVEQIRDGGSLREMTAKLYHKNDDGSIELRAFSDDPRWDHHIHLPAAELTQTVENGVLIKIKAIVIGSYRPAKIGRVRMGR